MSFEKILPNQKRVAIISCDFVSWWVEQMGAEILLFRMREIILQDRDLHEKVIVMLLTSKIQLNAVIGDQSICFLRSSIFKT